LSGRPMKNCSPSRSIRLEMYLSHQGESSTYIVNEDSAVSALGEQFSRLEAPRVHPDRLEDCHQDGGVDETEPVVVQPRETFLTFRRGHGDDHEAGSEQQS
jgi:hypothetical protein